MPLPWMHPALDALGRLPVAARVLERSGRRAPATSTAAACLVKPATWLIPLASDPSTADILPRVSGTAARIDQGRNNLYFVWQSAGGTSYGIPP